MRTTPALLPVARHIAISLAMLLLVVIVVMNAIGIRVGRFEGAPVMIFGQAVNAGWAVVAATVVAMMLCVTQLWNSLKSRNMVSTRHLLGFALLSSVATLIYLVAALGMSINMSEFRRVPSSDATHPCFVIYQITSGMTPSGAGRFYVANSSWGLPQPTQYVWSDDEGADGIPDGSWEVRWESDIGTLITYEEIGIDPDDKLPARFSCSR